MSGNEAVLIRKDRTNAELIEDYRAHLVALHDATDRTIKVKMAHIGRLLGMLNDKHVAEIDEADFAALRTRMDGYKKKTVRIYMGDLGSFVEFVTGHNPYLGFRARENPAYFVRRQLFADSYAKFEALLASKGLTPNSIEGALGSASMGLCILLNENPDLKLEDIGPEDIRHVEQTLGDNCKRFAVLTYLGKLLDCATGENPVYRLREMQSIELEHRHWFEDFRFGSMLKEYYDWMVYRQYRPATVKTTMRGIIYAYQVIVETIAELDGVQADEVVIYPNEINDDLLVRVRNAQTKVRDITLKNWFGNLNGWLNFLYGEKPVTKARIRWMDDSRIARFLDDEQWDALLSAADPTERIVLVLGACLGLRRAEIAGLMLDDIDGNVITIHGKGPTVHGKVVRQPMTDQVVSSIEEYLVHRAAVLERFGDHSDGHLVVADKGMRPGYYFTPERLATVIHTLASRTDISLHAHMLRRSFAMDVYKATGDIVATATLMRHAQIDTTFKHYINKDPDSLRSTMLAVSDKRLVQNNQRAIASSALTS